MGVGVLAGRMINDLLCYISNILYFITLYIITKLNIILLYYILFSNNVITLQSIDFMLYYMML